MPGPSDHRIRKDFSCLHDGQQSQKQKLVFLCKRRPLNFLGCVPRMSSLPYFQSPVFSGCVPLTLFNGNPTWYTAGKVLAGGQADGTLVLYDVEDGEALQSRQVHMDPISTAEWLEVVPCTNAGILILHSRHSVYVVMVHIEDFPNGLELA